MAIASAGWLVTTPVSAQTQMRLCPGDCRGTGAVTVVDLALGVRIILGLSPLSACPAMDPFRTGNVMVAQLVRAVSSVLFGCGEMIQDTLTDFDVVDLGGAHAALRQGAPPEPSGGPMLSVPAAATVPGGIRAGVPIESSAPVSKVFLAIDDAFGYYEVDLPQPTDVFPTGVTFAGAPPRTNFDCLFSVADAQGRVGTVGITSITIDRELATDTITAIRASTGAMEIAQRLDGLPPPATGGPAAMVTGNGLLFAGTTTTIAVQADTAYASIIVSVRDASGFYQVDLAAPATRRLFDVSISGMPPRERFDILTSVVLPDGKVGPPGVTRITILDEEE
jgi:hypothetical protein